MPMEEIPKAGVRFSELLLVLQKEIQQAIEFLSLVENRKIDKEQAPSTGFVIPNKIAVRLPVILELQGLEIPKDLLQRYKIPMKPFIRILEELERMQAGEAPKEAEEDIQLALILNVRIPSEKEPPTVTAGELNIEFLVSVK